MVGFASLRSLEAILQTQPKKTLQYNIKKEHANVSLEGKLCNITQCQAHFQSLLLIIIVQSLKPLNLLSTKDT